MPTATCPGPGATAGSSSIRKSPAACTTHAYTVTSSEYVQHAAVDVLDLTIHEVGRRRGQEDERTDQVLQLPPPPGRRSLLDPRTEFLVGHQRRVELRVEVSRPQPVDLDPGWAEVGTHTFGQLLQPAFGRGVRRNARPDRFTLHRADVDDLAAATRRHPPTDLAAHQERTGEIGADQLVPVLVGELGDRRPPLHPRIVDQDVDRPDLVLDRSNALRNSPRVRHIESARIHRPPVSPALRNPIAAVLPVHRFRRRLFRPLRDARHLRPRRLVRRLVAPLHHTRQLRPRTIARPALSGLRHVARHLVAPLHHTRQLRPRRLERRLVAPVQHHRASCRIQSFGERAPDPPTGSGDQRRTSGDVEQPVDPHAPTTSEIAFRRGYRPAQRPRHCDHLGDLGTEPRDVSPQPPPVAAGRVSCWIAPWTGTRTAASTTAQLPADLPTLLVTGVRGGMRRWRLRRRRPVRRWSGRSSAGRSSTTPNSAQTSPPRRTWRPSARSWRSSEPLARTMRSSARSTAPAATRTARGWWTRSAARSTSQLRIRCSLLTSRSAARAATSPRSLNR